MSDIPGSTPDPVAAPEPTPAPAAPAPGPWADFLGTLPEEARPIADAYMRETVQPRITQLEQAALPDGQRQFWDDFAEDQDAAVKNLLAEVYGEEGTPFFDTAVEFARGNYTPDPDADPPAGDPPETPELELEVDEEGRPLAYDPRVTEAEDDRAYGELLGQLQKDNPTLISKDWDAETVDEVLSPYLYAAEGDAEKAIAAYSRARELVGAPAFENPDVVAQLTPEQQAALAAESNPPSTLDGGTSPAVPTDKVYSGKNGLSDAIQDFLDENRAAPPTV